MALKHGSNRDDPHGLRALERPQPEYRVNLTLAVVDPQALWAAAAAKLLSAPDMILSDVIDVIGPREDPSIIDCLAMMAKPAAVAGCMLDDFWIDGLHGCPARPDAVATGITHQPGSADTAPRRLPTPHRARARQTLVLLPPLQDDAPTN